MSGCWYDFSPHSVQFSCTLSLQALPFFAHHLFLHLCSRATCVWLFMIYLNGQLTYRLSGPSYPPLVQWHPYLPVPHGLPQPSIPTIQSPVLSLSPATLPSSLQCSLSAQHPHPPVSHTILQPSIPTLQSLMPSLSPASPPSMPVPDAFLQPSIPTLQSLMKCPPSAQHPYPPVPIALPQPCMCSLKLL